MPQDRWQGRILDHRQLRVYRESRDAAMALFEASQHFPRDERYALTSQMRRSSRSVCANIAEAWQKRRYPAAFVAKLTEAAGEAGETRVWIEFAELSGWMDAEAAKAHDARYDGIIAGLAVMSARPGQWKIR